MPVVTRDIDAVLRLYNQARVWRVLPCAGGLLDQPASLMDLLEIAEAESQRCQAKRMEDERNRQAKEESLKRMRG